MSKKTTVKRATPAAASHAGPARETTSPAPPAARRAGAQQDRQDRIAQRAYGLYEQRGRQDGRDLEDWFQAERQLKEMHP